MLGIIVSFHSFKEFLYLQIDNIQKFVKIPYHVYVVDNSQDGELQGLWFPSTSILRNADRFDSPSGRHQSSVNMGIAAAWGNPEIKDCLIFDNDMIFLTEWNPPYADLVYEPCKRGNWEYCWLNLLYLKKFQSSPFVFQFANCPETNERTDSGGSSGFLLRNPSLDKRTIRYISDTPEREMFLPWYQTEFKDLCNQYNLPWWFDVYSFNGTKIFHFRAMSNYTNYPEEFMNKKRNLVLRAVSRFREEKSFS
jgi:hypothetical protein